MGGDNPDGRARVAANFNVLRTMVKNDKEVDDKMRQTLVAGIDILEDVLIAALFRARG